MTILQQEDEEGPEDGTKPPRIEIRLTVPANNRSEVLLNYEMQEQLRDAKAIFSEQQQLPLVPSSQAIYEEEILEATMSIRYGSPTDTVREASIEFARSFCRSIGHGLHEAVRLEFMSRDSYFMYCWPEHRNVELTSFSLGSFRNYGVFDDYFNMSWTEASQKPIMMDFEHDVKRMQLYCLYQEEVRPQREQFRQRGGRDQQVVHGIQVYRLSFDYKSIHSIVVDYSGEFGEASIANGAGTNEAVIIYFRFKYPPRINAGSARINQRDARDANLYGACMMNRRRGPRYNRVRRLPDFRAEAIGKCNVLKIVLWPVREGSGAFGNNSVEWHESVNAMLGRLKIRSACRLYYTGVRTKPGRENPLTITPNFLPSFNCYYLLYALICTRTYNIQDQVNETFLNYVRRCVRQNERASEMALSQLLAAADENRYFSLMHGFRRIFEVYVNEGARAAATTVNENGPPSKQQRLATTAVLCDDEEIVAKNCVKVRKLVVTPTRVMLLSPEVIMSNRVLRKFGEEYALRVVIRDEEGQKYHDDSACNDWVRSIMSNDYFIGERRYQFLGWSNSQLRDNAFYMYSRTANGHDVQSIRHWCGDFTAIQNVPKYMSRMGQCFTQAQTSLELTWSGGLVGEEDDIIGGTPDPHTGEQYNFSDGIGRMAVQCAEEVCKRLDITPVRSAYQIRYAGFKGMLVVDPTLDQHPLGKWIVLRKSMHKFESDTSYDLEIVKHSQPSPVYLNRPLVMILDQVSEKPLRSRKKNEAAVSGHSDKVHREVCNRIHELLDEELFSMADMLLDEKLSATALKTRTTLSIDFRKLKDAGFQLTMEPFFRNMLLAIHNYTIKQQLWKQKIEVSPDHGRTMYGVLDTTGLLQYGQVFVQYSKQVDKPGVDRQIVEGYVMVTKNPCIVPGDIRILKAVRVPSLEQYMHDVIVFPRNGARPHTDEMAGSDLDGDEYSVYWDPKLMFHLNQVQEPMHFPKHKPTDVEGGITDEHMVNFFCDYLSQDSIGKVSNAHLASADRYGLFNRITNGIAIKCSMAVDFPKTGVPAERLTREESPYTWPDFFEKYHRPMYRSKRLVGKLYRRVKNASDILRLGQDSVSQPSMLDSSIYDVDLVVQGWEVYKDDAIASRNNYVQGLQAIMDQYGITDEGALISGHMVAIRNRVSDGEKEDFSQWNTEKFIEGRLTNKFAYFRRQFCEEFGRTGEELLNDPDEKMQQKASAWYMVTYPQRNALRGRIMLSFPWIVWEVLAYIKLRRTYEACSRQMSERTIDPVTEALNRTIDEYCIRNPEIVARLISMVTSGESADSSGAIVSFYLESYNPDFGNLLAVILHWAEKEIGFNKEDSMRPITIANLLVQFCLERHFLERRTTIEHDEQPRATSRRLPSKAEIYLAYLKYLASLKHQEALAMKMSESEATINLRRRQMRRIGQVAFKTYHHVAWTSRFDSLHLQSGSRLAQAALSWDDEETDAITVTFDLSPSLTEEQVEKRLKMWSGVRDVRIRQKGYNEQNEYLVTGIGSLESRQALHDILLTDNLDECLVENKNPLLEQEY